MKDRRLIITVERQERVETLLRRELGCSSGVIRTAKEYEDGILLDGVHATTVDMAQPGQVLSILISQRDLLVVDKAAGVAAHPGPGHHNDTLGNYLTGYYQVKGIPFVYRPAHRLDRHTSGLMVVALHAYGQELLKNQLHAGDFSRTYLAVCKGTPERDEGVIDAPIGRKDGSVLMRQVREDGARAVTHYRVLKRGEGRSLVQLELETGRTHQIRVHMAWLGHPLVGDFLYGEEDKTLISRTALHSWKLSLTQPLTGERLNLTAPLPEDMLSLV